MVKVREALHSLTLEISESIRYDLYFSNHWELGPN